jgi:hypothetical protein
VTESLGPFNPESKSGGDGRVVELKLEGKQVTDAALDEVRKLPELRSLSLYGSSVTDAGLARLAEATKLEALGLGQTKVTRQGLAHQERLPSLRRVWVTEGPKLTAKDIDDFKAKAVPGVTVNKQ